MRTIAGLIDWQLYSTGNSLDTRYILLRDQAFFKVKFVWADSARDLGRCVAQEIKITRNDEAFYLLILWEIHLVMKINQ